jgi:transcription antitermination factor NusG
MEAAMIESKTNSIVVQPLSSPPQNPIAHWYVVQTCAQHERRVSEQLGQRSIENFLPLYERVSQWKDRRVRLQLPLFAGYVFVRLAVCERLRVLKIPSVVRLVGFGGMPAALADEELDSIRNSLNFRLRAEPCPYLSICQRVRVHLGPLQGVEGILVRKKSGVRLILSVDLIQRSMSVEIDAADVTAMPV